MSHRTKVVGARAPIIWLLILITLVIAAILAVGRLVIYPQFQRQQAEQVRQAEAEQHYQAGIAFQDLEDWAAAEAEFKQVIVLDADYKDTQTRLTEVKARLVESAAAATAVAMAQIVQAQTAAQATVVAISTATAEVQVNAQATVVAASAATAEALETYYQAGVAFQEMGDWQAAEEVYKQVVVFDADYKDVQARLAEVKAKLVESGGTATAVAIAQVEQTREAKATATAIAASTATAETLEAHYQKGVGNMNIGRWEEAKSEFELVYNADPNYKDIQTRMIEVDDQIAEIRALTPTPTSTSEPPKSRYTVHMYDVDDVATLYINDRVAYKAKYTHYGVEPDWYYIGHKRGDSGELDITSMLRTGTNSLRFELWNDPVCCETALSIQIKKDHKVIFSDDFYEGDSSSGIKYNKTVTITIP